MFEFTARDDPPRPATTRNDPLRFATCRFSRFGSHGSNTVRYGSVLTVRFTRFGSHGSVATVRLPPFGSHGAVSRLHAPSQFPVQFGTVRFARFGSHGSKWNRKSQIESQSNVSLRAIHFACFLCSMGQHNNDPLRTATTRYDPLRPANTRYDPPRPATTRYDPRRPATVRYFSGLAVWFSRFEHCSLRFGSHGSVLTVRFTRFGYHRKVRTVRFHDSMPVSIPFQFGTVRFARFGSHGSK